MVKKQVFRSTTSLELWVQNNGTELIGNGYCGICDVIIGITIKCGSQDYVSSNQGKPKARIYKRVTVINEKPVIFHWKYKMDELAI